MDKSIDVQARICFAAIPLQLLSSLPQVLWKSQQKIPNLEHTSNCSWSSHYLASTRCIISNNSSRKVQNYKKIVVHLKKYATIKLDHLFRDPVRWKFLQKLFQKLSACVSGIPQATNLRQSWSEENQVHQPSKFFVGCIYNIYVYRYTNQQVDKWQDINQVGNYQNVDKCRQNK